MTIATPSDFAASLPGLRANLTTAVIIRAAIVASLTVLDRGALVDLPWALIAQALTLPVLFGVFSQAISYRRAARALTS